MLTYSFERLHQLFIEYVDSLSLDGLTPKFYNVWQVFQHMAKGVLKVWTKMKI